MVKKVFLFTLFMVQWFFLWAQYTIDGTFTGLANEKVTLLQTFANQNQLIDTTFMNANGSFKFILNGDLPTGQYRIVTSSGTDVFLIFNNEDIQFIESGGDNLKYVQIIKSVENMIYYDFENLKQKNLMKLDILDPVITYYPKTDPFYNRVIVKAEKLRKELTERASVLEEKNAGTLASRFIRMETPVFAGLGLSEEEEKQFLKAHYFDHVDFSDTILLKSSTLNTMFINYMTLYQNRNDDRETFENNLLSAVDSILQKTMVNPDMYASAVDFLLKGFESIGFDKGVNYISEHNKLDEFCENTNKIIELQEKLELINRLTIGKTAPDFSYQDINGDTISLHKIHAKKTLLVFWASWCPHCQNMIPAINKLKDKYNDNDLEIIGISVDTSLTDLRKVIKNYQIKWPVIAELKGWEGDIPTLYGIVATPTMFLLDEHKKIIAKPVNKTELKKVLKY